MNGILPIIVLTLGIFVYMFWPEKNPFVQRDKTRADYLRERKDVIYENLRDLNFEYLAGKYPEQDYIDQRNASQAESSAGRAKAAGGAAVIGGHARFDMPRRR